MKKVITLLVAGALGLGVLPATAGAGAPKQTVEGIIALPAPYTDDSGCFAGLHRRGAIATQENNNGVVGWHFDVDPKTVGKKFVLEPSGGLGDVDMDILFYDRFGTVEDLQDPLAAGSPASTGYQNREIGGETGKVPPMKPKAIICIYGGQQGAGGGATFTYTAG